MSFFGRLSVLSWNSLSPLLERGQEFLRELCPEELMETVLDSIRAVVRALVRGAGYFLLACGGLTLAAALAGNVRLIAAAGFIWLIVIGYAYGLMMVGKDITDWAGKQIVSEGSLLARVAEWASDFFFLAAGICGSVAAILLNLHLTLARGFFADVGGAATALMADRWSIKGLVVTSLPLILGCVAQLLGSTRQKPGFWGGGAKFFTSFELVRGLYILGCGLWGAETFNAADTILQLPADDMIWSIPLFLPVGLLSPAVREAALTLYQRLGVTVFWLLFGLVPLIMTVAGWFEWVKSRREHERFETDQRLALLTGCWLLLLSGTVGYRTGDFEWWVAKGYAHFWGHPIDKSLVACIDPVRGNKAGELTCVSAAENAWQAELDRLSDIVGTRLPVKQHSSFQRANAAWRKNLDAATRPAAAKIGAPPPPDALLLVSKKRMNAFRERTQALARQYGVE